MCVTAVRGALKDVPGVGNIEIEPGDPDFTVHFDSETIKADAIVDLLVKGGEKGAKLKS